MDNNNVPAIEHFLEEAVRWQKSEILVIKNNCYLWFITAYTALLLLFLKDPN